MATPPSLPRHTLVWLSAQGWQGARAGAPPRHADALARWHAQDWPAVVRRSDADAAGDEICLGVPLPPDPATGDKLRIALRVRRGDVCRSAPPLSLATLLPTLAAHAASTGAWPGQPALPAQDEVADAMRVYGSAAMQRLTGLPYLRAASDIDLLFHPASAAHLEAGLAWLAAAAQRFPIDGEIVFPGARAVAWKEWLLAAGAKTRVLVKELDVVRLAAPDELLATLERHHA